MSAKPKSEHTYRVTNIYPEVTPEEHAELMQKMANRLYDILRPYCQIPQKEPDEKE